MRRRLGPLAALAAAVAAIVAISLIGSPGGRPGSDPSSRARGPGGTLALHDWLAELGLSVSRVSGSFDLSGVDVLVLVEPTDEVTDPDLEEIDGLLQRGGLLILATDSAGLAPGRRLVDALGLEPAAAPAGAAVPVQPYDVSELVHRVPVREGVAFPDSSPDQADLVPLLASGGRNALVGVALGRGRAFALGSPYPLTNDGLRRDDAAFMVLSLLERAGGRHTPLHVGFDEVHHGERLSATGAAAIVVGPVGLAALIAALVVLAWLGLSGRRLGRPVPAAPAAAVPSAATLVRAMAGLYERSRARSGVADRYAAELKERIGAAAGVDPGLDDQRFVELLARWDPLAAADVAEVLRGARRLASGRADDAAVLELARRTDDVERRHGGLGADA